MILRRLVTILLVFGLVQGCSDTEDDSTPASMSAGGMTGNGGSSAGGMMPSTGGMAEMGGMAAGGMGTGGMGTGGMGTGGMATGGMGEGGAEPFMADCSMPNQMCYRRRASGNRLMIQMVHVPGNLIELVNRTNDPIDIHGWQAVQSVTTVQIEGEDGTLVVPPFETVLLEFETTADDDAVKVAGSALESADELGLYAAADAAGAADLRAFLAWGAATDSEAAGHATANGLWPAGEYAGICGENVGLFAVGDVSKPDGYRSVPADCF